MDCLMYCKFPIKSRSSFLGCLTRRAVDPTIVVEIHSGRFRRDVIHEVVTFHRGLFISFWIDLRIVVIIARAAVADQFGNKENDLKEDDKQESEKVKVVGGDVADVEEEERKDCDEDALLDDEDQSLEDAEGELVLNEEDQIVNNDRTVDEVLGHRIGHGRHRSDRYHSSNPEVAEEITPLPPVIVLLPLRTLVSDQLHEHPDEQNGCYSNCPVKGSISNAEIRSLKAFDDVDSTIVRQGYHEPSHEPLPEIVEVLEAHVLFQAARNAQQNQHQEGNSEPADSRRDQVAVFAEELSSLAVRIHEVRHELNETPLQVQRECSRGVCEDQRKDVEHLHVVQHTTVVAEEVTGGGYQRQAGDRERLSNHVLRGDEATHVIIIFNEAIVTTYIPLPFLHSNKNLSKSLQRQPAAAY